MNPGRPSGSSPQQRGSVLLTVLIFAAIIAISIGSYLHLSRTNLELAHRSYYSNVAVSLAESGLEEAIWTLNHSAWSSWPKTGTDMSKSFTGIKYTGDTPGSVLVYVKDYNTASVLPQLYARSTITPHRGNAVEKWLHVKLEKGSSPLQGLVVQKFVVAGGAAIFDSYRSKIDNVKVPYNTVHNGKLNRYSNINLVALSIEADTADIANSAVYGYIAVGSLDPDVGLAELKNVAVLTGDVTLPVSSKTKEMDRVQGGAALNLLRYTDPPAPTSLATMATASGYKITANDTYGATNVTLTGSTVLEVADGVTATVVLTSPSTAMKVGGNAKIILGNDSKLRIYTAGDIEIAGTIVMNNGYPEQFMIFGTKAEDALTPQKIDFTGGGIVQAVINAPDADVLIKGNGHFFGSVVGRKATLNGNMTFSWDEELGKLSEFSAYRPAEWRELVTATERQAVSAYVGN